LAFPETLALLRLQVLRAILMVFSVLGAAGLWAGIAQRPELLVTNGIALGSMLSLTVLAWLRPRWYGGIAVGVVALILTLEHVTGSAWLAEGFQPGVATYPVIIMLTAFLGSGRLLLVTVLFLGFELTRYSEPSDPTLSTVWTNSLMGFVAASLLAGLLEQELLDRILMGTVTRSSPGTVGERGNGFGLRLVRDFATMMGGRILTENTPNGVRIGVAIPLATAGVPRPG